MTRLAAITGVSIAFLSTVPRSASACPAPTSLSDLLRRADIIAVATITAVEPEGTAADRQCVRLVPQEFLRGSGDPGEHEICFRMNRRFVGQQPVKPGEVAIVFATAERAGRFEPLTEQSSVISPSNVACALSWDDVYTFEAVEKVVRQGVGFESADAASQGAIALEFAQTGRPEMVEFLLQQAGRERPVRFDPATVIPELIRVARKGERITAPSAFRAAQTLDGRGHASAWFMNELMDVAVGWMGSEDEVQRGVGLEYVVREWLAEVGTAYSVAHGVETFGYAPDATAEARAVPTQRWRDWWAAHRGRGHFDTSPERIAELKAQDAEARRRSEDRDRRMGEDLRYRIEHGLAKIDLSDPYSKYQIKYLAAAGYELAPDGSVVPVGSVQPGVGGHGADLDAIEEDAEARDPDVVMPSEGDAGGADEGAAGIGAGPEKRRGCGCAVPGAGGPTVPLVALWSAAFVAALRTGRRRG